MIRSLQSIPGTVDILWGRLIAHVVEPLGPSQRRNQEH